MSFTQDFRTQRRNYEDGDTRIGEKDRIWYDSITNTLRISDGETPGGVPIGGAGGTSYILPTATTTVKGGVKVDGTTITINDQVISGFSGSYTDLSNKPTIPTNNNQLTNGAGYITSSSLPTATSALTNDSGFLTENEFDLNTIDYDGNNNLHATGILPGDDEGFTAVFAGRAAGIAALPNTVIQSQAQVNDYAQNNFQNTFDGNHASTEWVATSPNGDDSNYYIDFGINGAAWDGTAANSLYTNVGQRDGWVYVQGGNAGGGNLVLGTSLDNTYTKIISGDASSGNTEVARFSSTEIKLEKQLTFSDNTTQTTAWTGSVSYNDLDDLPTLVTSYNDLSDLPTLITSYNELANLPELFSGSYDDLTDKPTLFSGSYNDLTDVPSAPTIALGDSTDVDLTTPPVIGQVLKFDGTKWAPGTDITSGGAGTDADTLDGFDSTYYLNYNNFTNKPTIPTTVTVNGTAITLDSSGTITANTTNALTIGTGLKGTSSTFDGSAANTIALDTSVTAVTATAGATTTLSAATLTRYYQVTGSLSGTHIFRLPDLTTLTAGQQITFFTSQATITFQLSTGTAILTNTVSTARQTTFTVVSNAANTTANLSYTQVVAGLSGAGTSLLTNIQPSINVAYITGLDSTTSTTAYASTPTLTLGSATATFNQTLNIGTAAVAATYTKTLNLGTNLNGGTGVINIGTGVTSGTATLNIGSSTSTVQVNGTTTITNLTATNPIVGSVTGNAATATKLGTARTINGVNFDGTEGITVTANTTNALTIGTGLSGTSFNGSTGVTIAIDNTVALRADTHYIGTTAIALNRASGSQTLTGVSIDGNAATVTNGLYSTGSYSNPSWLTSLAYSKISGAPTIPVNVSQLINDSGYITASAIPPSFTFNVAADDSTVIAIGTQETVKFIGSTGIDTSSNAEGAITISVDSTVVRTSDTGKVTNAMLEGNIANAKLFNSTVTIGSTVVALGTTTANLAGLNSVTATNFIGNATTVTNGVYTNSIGVVTDIMLAGSIANNKLANSSVTVNGTSISLGSSATIKASTTNALTIGTGLSGTSFDGGSAVTIALASGYGDTQNPYASKTANYVLAAPNGSNGAPTFRALVAADIPTLNQNTTGSAATLTTARNINGVAFNGSADITVTAAAGTLTGTTLNSTVVTSSLTSVGTLNGLTVSKSTTGTALSITATNAGAYGGTATWQFVGNGNIGGPGSWIQFPDSSVQTTAYTGNAATVTNGVYTTDTGTVTNTMLAGSIANNKLANSSITINGSSTALGGSVTISTITGNAGTATKLATARAINGVDFDGSAAITVTAAAGTLTGTTLNSSVVSSSLTSVGTLTGLAVTTTATGNAVNVTYNPPSANGAAYFATGKDTAGGTGYFDFLRATNTTSGVTNATKTFRVNSVGTLEILNSAYNATILSVTDAGFIAINASTGSTNGVPVNNAVAMNNNSYIYDDGNYHLTAKTGQIWLNSNDGSAVSINQQMPSGITAGGLKVTGPVNAQSAYYGRTPWNSAIDTEVTIDDYRFRISNQGGIFPQVISNTGGTKNSAWVVVAARSGSAITQTGSTGNLVPNNSWVSLYTSGGMDSAGDTFVCTLQDKNEGRIYRITFMRSDNGSTTGYNIIAERLL